MLRRLRDRDHVVCTAFTLIRMADSSEDGMHTISDAVQTTVHMRRYSDAEIEAYIASKDPFDKAGSYAIQNTDFDPVAYIDGCRSNVMGLPLCAVKRALAQIGWPGIAAPDGCDCPPFVPRR